MKPWSPVVAVVALLAFAVPALAADHTTTLSSSAPKFEWEGAPEITRGSPLWNEQIQDARLATPCDSGPARPCETVHVQLTGDGKLAAKAVGAEGTGGTTDIDLYLYASDASGAQGELLVKGGAAGDDNITLPKAKTGYYLLVADYYSAYNSGYKGTLTFTGSAPPAPAVTTPVAGPPTPATTAPAKPAPTAKQKAAAKRKACQKKAKKIKNKKKRSKALKKCKKIK